METLNYMRWVSELELEVLIKGKIIAINSLPNNLGRIGIMQLETRMLIFLSDNDKNIKKIRINNIEKKNIESFIVGKIFENIPYSISFDEKNNTINFL